MSEPSLKYCTKRDGYDDNWDGVSDAPYIDLECRFSDGQKFAAVRIDAEFPVLADKIANFLNAGTSDNKRLDEILSDALAGSPETHVAILAREVVRLREARAVVVPAWDASAFALACVKEGAYAEGDLRDAIKNAEMGYNFAVSRARSIPADRVLGYGEVKMEICERDCREDDEDALEVLRVCGYGQQAEMLEVAIKAHDLRANQGGSEHGKV